MFPTSILEKNDNAHRTVKPSLILRVLGIILSGWLVCPSASYAKDEDTHKGEQAMDRKQYDTAVEYFKQAADRGDKNAQMYLARIYCYGIQLPVDAAMARKYAEAACALGQGMQEACDMQRRIDSGKGGCSRR